MSDSIAINVENVTKTYKLYDSPLLRLKESLNPLGKKYHKKFFALNDVSLKINKGETVGILGRNGSGKSTLLKIITGILTPSSGSVSVVGKISALLELGAGFNPELTGIENVYFNGTILGYTRKEMDAKLDEILSFADIGEFIYQPVKTYSSGMFIRLAFGVAINIDPDILIVDEALSVGDEAFQRKCFARIMDFKKKGKTILFVSHSVGTILELCDRAILLDHGERLLSGVPKPVVTSYQKLLYAPADKIGSLLDEIKSSAAKNDFADDEPVPPPGDPAVIEEEETRQDIAYYDANLIPKSTVSYESQGAVIEDPHVTTVDGKKVNILNRGEQYVYNYTVRFDEDAYNVRFAMLIKTVRGLELGGMISHPPTDSINFVPAGTFRKQSFIFKCALTPGAYFLNAGVQGTVNGTGTYLHRLIDAVMFKVQSEKKILATGTVDFSSN